MLRTLHTVGYELAVFDDFVATLLGAGVRCVLDVRAVPNSRKPGFSKNQLRRLLQNEGVDYLHVAALGDPKLGRQAARAREFAKFRRIYEAHLKSASSLEGLRLVSLIASKTSTCLLCYERDATVCHRSLVAEKVSLLSKLEVHHLVVDKGAASDKSHEIRRSSHPRQGRAAA